MSQENDQYISQADETRLRSLFSKLSEVSLEPTPYLKTRVLAHLRESQEEKRKLRFWQWVSVSSLAAFLVLGIYSASILNQLNQAGTARQSYVIHVDFDQNDLSRVAKAEVVLSKDVYFVSSQGQVQSKRNLTLPLEIKSTGRDKLPFVIASESQGEKKILVRLLDENDQLVREKTLNFKFAKKDGSIAL